MVRSGLALLAAGALVACGGAARSGSACDAGAGDYPCGPYGLTVGSTIANLTIVAQRDSNASGSVLDDPAQPVTLAAYRAEPQRAALAIIIGTESCVPCQNEQPELVALHARYGGRVAFLEAIVEDSRGAPADQQVIDAWVARFGVPFDMTADPTGALAPYYPATSFPSALAIRLATMEISYLVVGPAVGLEAALDAIVAP